MLDGSERNGHVATAVAVRAALDGGGVYGVAHHLGCEDRQDDEPVAGVSCWDTHTNKHNVVIVVALSAPSAGVPTGSPSCGGDVAVYVFDIIQLSLPTSFYSILVSVSVFMILSTVFHSINSPDNSPLSHSVLPGVFLPYWSFQLYIPL